MRLSRVVLWAEMGTAMQDRKIKYIVKIFELDYSSVFDKIEIFR